MSILAPENTMVTYRFKTPDLGDYFESFSGEQSHVALEGALNIIFGKPAIDPANIDPNDSEAQSDEELALDHESQIVQDVAFALATYQLSNTEGDLNMPDDITLDPIYMLMEEQFRTVANKLATDIANDKENQDVITLLGEMEFFNRIELFNHNYDSKNEVLMVTLSSCN